MTNKPLNNETNVVKDGVNDLLATFTNRQVIDDFDTPRGVIGVIALVISAVTLSIAFGSTLPAGVLTALVAFNFLTEPKK